LNGKETSFRLLQPGTSEFETQGNEKEARNFECKVVMRYGNWYIGKLCEGLDK